jgi:ARG/rhodanese/phosphatase superfamily protein
MVKDLIQLGDPVQHRGVVIAPLFPRSDPRAEYVTLEEALPLGFQVSEVDASGSVPELAVDNPLDSNVLLYDGEELVGAKQNRILNVTVLVAAASKTRIPVSCVEQGRWSSRSARFDAASHAAYPELRRRKAHSLLAAPLARGVGQAEVWDSVAAKAHAHETRSPTGAQADIFASRYDDLKSLGKAFPLQQGQAGALLALGDRICLDYVSRPEAFARLYPKLLSGYLLDAIEQLDGESAGERALAGFLQSAASAPRSRRPSEALGEDIRLAGDGVVGSGLELDGELLQLSVYSSDARPTVTAIAAPRSRRDTEETRGENAP